MGIVMMFMSSCVTAQTPVNNYPVVYYDYVIGGVVDEIGFVNDGYYSYHIIGQIPMNTYWTLYPSVDVVYVYNRSMTYRQVFKPNNWWVFYNKHRHHTYDHNHRHYNRHPQPAHKPHNPPHKPGNGYRPSQPHNKPHGGHNGGRPNNNHRNRGRH